MTVLVTGVAGFVGMHVAERLLDRGDAVLGLDDLNGYYDPGLKRARLARLEGRAGFSFVEADVADRAVIERLGAVRPGIGRIVHLAAQPGVRHSLVDPHAYVTANVTGQLNMLELARRLPGLEHLVYASSSSVYGGNTAMPFRESDEVSRPRSLYAATKRADELMSESYRHLFGLPLTGLRFFTVYGPWGRPDMAVWRFAEAILRGEPVTLYDGGRLRRDFTYVDDIAEGVVAVLDRAPQADIPAPILNIGNNRSEAVIRLVGLLEAGLGRHAVIRDLPAPATEVPATFASIEALAALTGFAPRTSLEEGIGRFCAWFTDYAARGVRPAASASRV